MSTRRFLKNSPLQEKSDEDENQDDARFDLAEQAMSEGGYAGTKGRAPQVPTPHPEPQAPARRSPTSWNASEEDRFLLNREIGKLMMIGQKRPSQSQIISMAIKAFSELSENEKIELARKYL